MKRIAIYQPVYLPWKGYFDLIHRVDTFVFLDDVPYTEHYYINRNVVLTKDGPKWITVPVKHSGKTGQLICEVEIDNRSTWQRKHFNTFQMNYARAPYFKQYQWILEDLYHHHQWSKISDFNIYAIQLISNVLGIKTEFVKSTELDAKTGKNERLIDICKKLNGGYYLSAPRAKDYIVPAKFEEQKIVLDYIDYQYPEYQQFFQPFHHHVTVLDLIFHCGPEASYYIWGWKNESI